MQDLRNRQRNIVFPDTVLNEARGFRNILGGKTRPGPVQRFCMVLLGMAFLVPAAFLIRESISVFRFLEGWGIVLGVLLTLLAIVIWGSLAYLGFRLLSEGLMPGPVAAADDAERPPTVAGVIRRPFSQRPRRRMQRAKGDHT